PVRLRMSVVDANTKVQPLPQGNFEVSVFPNPSRETIHFRFQSPQSGTAQIRIYNALGQSVYTTQRAYAVGDNVLGITTLSPSHGGTFFYTIEGPHFQQRGRFTRMPTD
ncbi:MAG: T9SS type A sorting domain-containing protein, partial [Bacteroidota bacterium]